MVPFSTPSHSYYFLKYYFLNSDVSNQNASKATSMTFTSPLIDPSPLIFCPDETAAVKTTKATNSKLSTTTSEPSQPTYFTAPETIKTSKEPKTTKTSTTTTTTTSSPTRHKSPGATSCKNSATDASPMKSHYKSEFASLKQPISLESNVIESYNENAAATATGGATSGTSSVDSIYTGSSYYQSLLARPSDQSKLEDLLYPSKQPIIQAKSITEVPKSSISSNSNKKRFID